MSWAPDVPVNALVDDWPHENVLLEMSLAQDGSGKSLRPLNIFPADIKIEFPEKRLAGFPPGTFFRATTQVCQEHWPLTGKPKGDPYMVASNIHVHQSEGTLTLTTIGNGIAGKRSLSAAGYHIADAKD
jgi:hypothetical protein